MKNVWEVFLGTPPGYHGTMLAVPFLAPFEDRCWFCGVMLTGGGSQAKTREHLTPRCRGGKGNTENLVKACQRCNNEKGSMSLDEYRFFLLSSRSGTFWGEKKGYLKNPPAPTSPRPVSTIRTKQRFNKNGVRILPAVNGG